MRFAYINNDFIEEEKAVLGIKDLSIRRGFGIFDFFRNVDLTPVFLDKHLDRFYSSASIVGLPVPKDKGQLKEICKELIAKNNISDSGVRLILTGGYSLNGYTPTAPNLIITNEPLKLIDDETRNKGVKVISHEYQREFPEVKTISYFSGIMLQKKAEAAGGFDVLYFHKNIVLEFTRSNIFIVTDDNHIVTPKKDILHGITRGHTLKLAAEKYQVEERAVTMEELFSAKEVFMTGTTKRILPVVQIDDHRVGSGKPGPISMDIYSRFINFERQQLIG